MTLYPTLEDMVVHQQLTSMNRTEAFAPSAPMYTSSTVNYEHHYETPQLPPPRGPPPVYPALSGSYYPEAVATIVPQQQNMVVAAGNTTMVAPISARAEGLQLANLTHGVRQVFLVKDQKGKIGIRLRAFDRGVFVQFVADGSPAASSGIRFGDQILQINGSEVLGMSNEKAMDLITKRKNDEEVVITVRDRPFSRTITLHKDKNGELGFRQKDGRVSGIIKDSSASRNGLLINQNIVEVDGRCVVGYKTKEMKRELDEAADTVTLTLMPKDVYEEMVKKMDYSLLAKKQDHSFPIL